MCFGLLGWTVTLRKLFPFGHTAPRIIAAAKSYNKSSWLRHEDARVTLPEMMASLQVPLTSTFPSGQVHLAPVGLSRHMKSQDILRHGFDAVEKVKEKNKRAKKMICLSGLSWKRPVCVWKSVCFSHRAKRFISSVLISVFEDCYFLGAQRGTRLNHTKAPVSRLNNQRLWNVSRISRCLIDWRHFEVPFLMLPTSG